MQMAFGPEDRVVNIWCGIMHALILMWCGCFILRQSIFLAQYDVHQ